VAWFAQQDGPRVSATEAMADLEFYQVRPPLIIAGTAKLLAWHKARDAPGTRERLRKAAQVQAHYFALTLELPRESKGEEQETTSDTTLELALSLIASPKTFNKWVCLRIMWALEGGISENGFANGSYADRFGREEFSVLRNTTTHDCGGLSSAVLDKLRDLHPPRLVGPASRFLNF